MKLRNIYIDELIAIRAGARQRRDWDLSDEIRDYLDTKHIFIFDNKQEQIVYHEFSGTREEFIVQLKQEARAEKLFDSWLYSMNAGLERRAS